MLSHPNTGYLHTGHSAIYQYIERGMCENMESCALYLVCGKGQGKLHIAAVTLQSRCLCRPRELQWSLLLRKVRYLDNP